jgi:adenylate cyclase
LRLHLFVRFAALVAIAAFVVVSFPLPRALPGLGVLAVFAALGIVSYLLGRRSEHLVLWAGLFVLLDVALLTAVVLISNPFRRTDWPPQMSLRFSTVLYFFIYVGGMALSYSPSLVVWTGVLAAAAWATIHLIILRLPSTIATHGARLTDITGVTPAGALALYLDPYYVSVAAWETQTVLLLVLTAVLAVAVSRSRALLHRQVIDALARANLSRYFSPNVVDQLAGQADPDGVARRQPVAVLFADIVGFTSLTEALGPERTMALLQSFHQRMTGVVFAHGGTLEKYIGDAVMATFGTPDPGPDDAGRALRCAHAMAHEMERWGEKRAAQGTAPVRIGIGLHSGEAVVGTIGDARRLDYAVIGDPVNVASRLEQVTRETDVDIVASEEFLTAVRREGHADIALLDSFQRVGEMTLRGRTQPITVWAARFAPANTTRPIGAGDEMNPVAAPVRKYAGDPGPSA